MSNLSGRWKFGLLLAASTAFMWGVLPIALKGLMSTLDPMTTTFFRLFIAAVLITPYLLARKKLVNKNKFCSLKLSLQLLCAGLLLTANYALYIFGLERSSPEAAQVMMQLAPVLLLLAGVWIFKEQFTPFQWCGFAIFIGGLILFFSPRFDDVFVSLNGYGEGLILSDIGSRHMGRLCHHPKNSAAGLQRGGNYAGILLDWHSSFLTLFKF